jgi:hypothetical protein
MPSNWFERFLRTLACRQTVRLIEAGMTPQSACEPIVLRLLALENVTAALLAVDTGGSVGPAYHGSAWEVEATEGPIAAVAVR